MHKLHLQQIKLPFEKNWTNNVFLLLKLYGLDYESVKEVTIDAWKEAVIEAVTTVAFHELISECSEKTKMYRLKSSDYVY